MKQSFNTEVALIFGIEAAIIVNIIVDFCKNSTRTSAFTETKNGKVFVLRCVIFQEVASYMRKVRFEAGIRILLNNGIIKYSRDKRGMICYAFTDEAKILFEKEPICIDINWQ